MGSVTASAAATATAASNALPPSRSTCAPAAPASGEAEPTSPRVVYTGLCDLLITLLTMKHLSRKYPGSGMICSASATGNARTQEPAAARHNTER